jgi:hypothetical protein
MKKAMLQLKLLVVGFPPRRSGLEPRSDHVGFVADKAALEQFFSKYSVFLAIHSTDCFTLIIFHHPGLVKADKADTTASVV